MKLRLKTIGLIAAGLLGAGAVGAWIFVIAGIYNVAATQEHTYPVYHLLHYAMYRAVKVRAPESVPPDLDSTQRVSAGAALYRDHCVRCHGAPGVPPQPFAAGMRPEPSNLLPPAREWKPEEIYWIIKHGVKMTGMPGWMFRLSEDDIWNVTAFVKALARLSPVEYADMVRKLPPAPSPKESPGHPYLPGDQPPQPRLVSAPLGVPDVGALKISNFMCATCHVIPGIVGADVQVGPPLTGIGGRPFIAGVVPNRPENMIRFLMNPQQFDQRSAMPDLGLTQQDAADIAAYLYQLGGYAGTMGASSANPLITWTSGSSGAIESAPNQPMPLEQRREEQGREDSRLSGAPAASEGSQGREGKAGQESKAGASGGQAQAPGGASGSQAQTAQSPGGMGLQLPTLSGVAEEDRQRVVLGQVRVPAEGMVAPLRFSGNALGQYGRIAVDPASGRFTYSLDEGAARALAQGEAHTEHFSLVATDARGRAAVQPVSITVVGRNSAPVITSPPQQARVQENAKVSARGTVVAQDPDHRATLSFRGDAVGRYGRFSIDTDSGQWLYVLDATAALALGEGESRTETFPVVVSDEHGASATQQVQVTVIGSNNPPVITSGPQYGTVQQGHATRAGGQVVATDPDHGAQLRYSGDAKGPWGRFEVDPPSGHWTYSLDPEAQLLKQGEHRSEHFTVTVTDEHGATASQDVSITIDGPRP